jgi:hypothetical protein
MQKELLSTAWCTIYSAEAGSWKGRMTEFFYHRGTETQRRQNIKQVEDFLCDSVSLW